MLLCAGIKIFCGDSGRRTIPELEAAHAQGLIEAVPHFNTLLAFFEDEHLNQILKDLIVKSSLHVRHLEEHIAIDSSSFSTKSYERWLDVKYGKKEGWYKWVKVHVACGIRTHIVTCADVSWAYRHDTNFFRYLLQTTAASGFEILEVLADKGYCYPENFLYVLRQGAIPRIPFKVNSQRDGKSTVWERMFDLFHEKPEVFLEHYHQRSNVETVFSMVKAKFGPHLRMKGKRSQRNEALFKILCHNLCVLVQCVFEFDLDLDSPPVPQGLLPFPIDLPSPN